ncbi:hypothetical protein [Halpernia frigidisoli]|uniref:Uncharacterized protein n=1 Tax=Halpernia frigidisoli TaxID=1125876 RepID=A0A1I3CQQ0_9FLAO|nr:hypothetical protein [Halpernia frigidisoli]SFH76581.1 hypothetical protein SAMN05443292_0003 [Halpernia frigidisoli]
MQEEITKHTTKIYRETKNKKHSLSEKIKEIAIEIFIIVFAVTLSIWMHSWSEHRHEQKDVNKFLVELRENISADIKLMEQSKSTAVALSKNYDFILALKESQVQNGEIYNHLDFSILNTNWNVGTYEGFKSSGKIATIEDDQLKYKILNYYQQSIPNLVSAANFINTEQLKIQENDLFTKGIYLSLNDNSIQNKYKNLNYNMKTIVKSYEEIIKEGKEIIAKSKEMK